MVTTDDIENDESTGIVNTNFVDDGRKSESSIPNPITSSKIGLYSQH